MTEEMIPLAIAVFFVAGCTAALGCLRSLPFALAVGITEFVFLVCGGVIYWSQPDETFAKHVAGLVLVLPGIVLYFGTPFAVGFALMALVIQHRVQRPT